MIRKKSLHLLSLRLAFGLLLGIAAAPVSADSASLSLPQQCVESCITPYGQVLGTTRDGIQSYSNCQSNCVVFVPNTLNGTYTGIKWQCVEFTRRWLIQNRGLTFGDVDVAADIWALKDLIAVDDKSLVPLQRFENGAKQMPAQGDLLIYGREFLGTGHAAIILQVDRKLGLIRVGEQNFRNQKWPGNYSRAIPFMRREGRYWILDAYLLGWMRTVQE